MNKQLEALIANIKADISARKAMPDFGPETWIERIKIINRTKASFSVETTELLIAALEREIAMREQNLSIKLHMSNRIAELESSETQLICERDNAEEALADMYQAATGERPEWSNFFSFSDAVDAVEQRLGETEASPLAVRLPESFYPDGDIDCPKVVEVEEVIEAIRAAAGKVEGE